MNLFEYLKTSPLRNMMSTIYTDSSDGQGQLTAHILTDSSHLRPTIMCYYQTFEELHTAVKDHYGQAAQYVGRAAFLAVMEHRNMSSSFLEA